VWNKWRALPPRWNAQHDMVVPWLAPQLPKPVQFHNRLPALVHFTGPEKPWLAGAYHPWAWLYWINIARTPFAKEVASKAGVSPIRRFRLWLRWMRKRPSGLWKRHPLHAA